jgi:hypothetical protein
LFYAGGAAVVGILVGLSSGLSSTGQVKIRPASTLTYDNVAKQKYEPGADSAKAQSRLLQAKVLRDR